MTQDERKSNEHHRIDPLSYGVGCMHNRAVAHETLPPNDEIVVNHSGPTTDTLYRFMDKQYAEELCDTGKLRIRDLGRYHDQSLANRCDRREGRITSPLLGINNSSHWNCTSCYILSLTRVPFKNLARKFNEKATATIACVKIANSDDFLKKLDFAVRQYCDDNGTKITSSYANHVAYCDFPRLNFGEYGCAIHGAFLKPHAHGNNQYWLESEYRAVWDTGLQVSGPRLLDDLNIQSDDIADHCTILPPEHLYNDSLGSHLQVRVYDKYIHSKWIDHCRKTGNNPPLPFMGTYDDR